MERVKFSLNFDFPCFCLNGHVVEVPTNIAVSSLYIQSLCIHLQFIAIKPDAYSSAHNFIELNTTHFY
jgi:hypothetical protein